MFGRRAEVSKKMVAPATVRILPRPRRCQLLGRHDHQREDMFGKKTGRSKFLLNGLGIGSRVHEERGFSFPGALAAAAFASPACFPAAIAALA